MLALCSRSEESKRDPYTATPRVGTYLQFSCPEGHPVLQPITSHSTLPNMTYCEDHDRETFPGSIRVEYK